MTIPVGVLSTFNVMDFLLALPPPRALEYQEILHTIEQEMQMPYVSSIEQLAEQKGMQQGIEQGSKEMQRGIASNLFKEGLNPETIMRLTGVSFEELRTLIH